MKLLICFGTRPEYIKVKPLIDSLDKTLYDICFIEQHTDLIIDNNIKHVIRIDKLNDNRLNSIITSVLCAKMPWADYEYILIQGDTASAYAIALSAFNHQRKIIHLEAGLRTYDNKHPYPEESYRCMISRLTDIHLCPGVDSVRNLATEKVNGKIYNVGNTVIDMLFKTIADNNIDIIPSNTSNKIIITLHRRENWGALQDIFIKLEHLAKEYSPAEFIFIKHPNPTLHKFIETHMPSVHCIPPQSYIDCVKLIAGCRFIITDSGGIQEEGAAIGKMLLVLREFTERTELVGHNVTLCNDNLLEEFKKVYNNPLVNRNTSYGTGDSISKIKKIIDSL